MKREFLQIIMIGSTNPSLQLKLHCSVLIPDMGLADHPLGPLAEKLPGPKASLTLQSGHHVQPNCCTMFHQCLNP